MLHMRKKWIWTLPVLFALISLCACTRTVVESAQDELKANTWSGKGEYMSTVALSFDGDKASLAVKAGGGAETKIAGNCIVSSDNITLTDEKLNESFTFGYNLLGDQIELTLNKKTITLQKVK